MERLSEGILVALLPSCLETCAERGDNCALRECTIKVLQNYAISVQVGKILTKGREVAWIWY